jgi:hypothetical protein
VSYSIDYEVRKHIKQSRDELDAKKAESVECSYQRSSSACIQHKHSARPKTTKDLFVADEDSWAQLQWQHAQLVQTAKQLPDCSLAACGDSAFGNHGLKAGNAAQELERLRKKNEELAKYGCIHC